MLKRFMSWYLVVAMFIIAVVPHAEGAFVPSSPLTTNESQRVSDLQKVQTFLETRLVQQRLEDLGFSAVEVKEKLSMLSDQQLHNYAQQLDNLRAGGDGIGFIIGVLVIIILVIVILHLTGHKVIVQ